MSKNLNNRMRFQTERNFSSSMISSSTKQTGKSGRLRKNNPSDDSLRALVDACISNVAVLDESGTILYASKAWRPDQRGTCQGAECFALAPYYFESCKRLTQSECDEGADISLKNDLQRILTGEEREFHRKYYCRSLNDQRPFVMHAAQLDLPGSAFRVLITREDIPSAREDVNKSKERLTRLLDTTKILAWEGEVEGQRFTYVSEQAARMFGYPADAWYKPNFLASHIHPDDRQRVLTAYLEQTRITEHFDLSFRMLCADGHVAWVHNLVSVKAEEGAPGRMHGFMIDISERKRAEERLKYLGSRLIAAQEEERKRVARELHDDLNQRMAVLSIELEQAGQKVKGSNDLRNRLQELQLQAQEISNDIHRLSYRLHPSKLDHLGLATAVKSLCDELSLTPSGKPRVHFYQIGFPADLPKDATLCVFRIAQEALRNCVKHSGAESAQVVLTKTDDAIHLSVSDNGCGFDSESEVMEKGLGFISMKERLRIVDGEISIWSQPLRGTRIEVSVPLSREPEAMQRHDIGSSCTCDQDLKHPGAEVSNSIL